MKPLYLLGGNVKCDQEIVEVSRPVSIYTVASVSIHSHHWCAVNTRIWMWHPLSKTYRIGGGRLKIFEFRQNCFVLSNLNKYDMSYPGTPASTPRGPLIGIWHNALIFLLLSPSSSSLSSPSHFVALSGFFVLSAFTLCICVHNSCVCASVYLCILCVYFVYVWPTIAWSIDM